MGNPHHGAGLIPLDSAHKAQVHNEALEKAALHLESTAADFEQMRDQTQRDLGPAGSRPSVDAAIVRAGIALMSSYDGKAVLLRGLTAHIREMKVRA